MSTWMLLERTDDLLPALFRTMGHPDFVELFDSTELARYSDSSPLLVQDNSDEALLQAMRTAPGTWRGLVIESEQSSEAVREHLRHILIIRFEPNRKGMLRYWNPDVASYFFPGCPDAAVKVWLGSIRRVSWYTESAARWELLHNSDAGSWRSAAPRQPLTVDTEHGRALEQYRLPSFPNGQES